MSTGNLRAIYQVWVQTDRQLVLIAPEQSFPQITTDRARTINDSGYFILLFAQLEDAVNDVYEQQIGPWDSASFLHRLHMLSGILSDEDLDDIVNDYELRCDVAHGRSLRISPIQISNVATRYLQVVEKLTG